jgi:hypothetical protein
VANGTSSSSSALSADRLSRPRYEAGAYLTAADCQLEQRYRIDRLRRHNRQLHGAGVVCGLWVVPAADPSRPWAVRVCPGYAVGPYGDEMQVREPAVVNLREFLWARGASFSSSLIASRRPMYVAIRAVDQPDRLVPVPSAACGCTEPVYHESRIADSCEVAAIWTPPAPVPAVNLCHGLPACPSCPESPWLALARVTLPTSDSQMVTAALIDNGIRQML